jgi:hypothetical protein
MSEPSNTLFDTSKPPPDNDPRPVIYLDHTFASDRLAEYLSKYPDWRVELARKHTVHNCPDWEWIPVIAKRGWIIFTLDKNIRKKQRTFEAARDSGAYIIILRKGGKGLEAYQSPIYAAAGKILRAVRKRPGGFFATLTSEAEFHIVGDDRHLTTKERTAQRYRPGTSMKQFNRPGKHTR